MVYSYALVIHKLRVVNDLLVLAVAPSSLAPLSPILLWSICKLLMYPSKDLLACFSFL
jgi:hypothetical protein